MNKFCNTTLQKPGNATQETSRVEYAKHAFWPSGASVRRPYSPHLSFSNYLKLFNAWLMYYATWHKHAIFLDIGSRGGAPRSQLTALRHFEYRALERDKRRAANGSLVCDLFDCPVGTCSADVVYSRYVLEHLVSAERGVASMAGFVKEGGLLLTILPWTSRYHAEDTYGHYTQLSARALEGLCIENGLNPVRSGYDSQAQRGESKDGVRKHNVLDRTPYAWPGSSEFNSFVVCYKPRRGERRVLFDEAGHLPVELFNRFELRFGVPGSEEPGFAKNASNQSIIVRARLLSQNVAIKDATACKGLRAGDLAILLSRGYHLSKPQVVTLHRGMRETGLYDYRGPILYVTLENGSRYEVETVGRC